MNLDGAILLWIQENLRTPVLNAILSVITHLGDSGIIWIILAVILLCFKKTRKVGVCTSLALLTTLFANELLLKHLIHRARPIETIEGLTTVVATPNSGSFPSGHSASSFASVFVLLMLVPKKYSIPTLVFGTVIALSRLYVGVHYPTDVLAGILMGISYGFVGWRLGTFLYNRKRFKNVAS